MTNRRTKIFQLAKGYYGRSKNCYKLAVNRVEHGLQHAYRARKQKKRDYRTLWIQNVKATTQEFGIKYHQFMYGLVLSGCQLNRKMLAELAKTEPLSMRSIVELSNQSRRTFELYKHSMNPELYATKKQDSHLIPFPIYATKDKKLMSDKMKHQIEIISKTLDKVATAEVLETELYEKKLQEYLAKNKVPEPDDDPDV